MVSGGPLWHGMIPGDAEQCIRRPACCVPHQHYPLVEDLWMFSELDAARCSWKGYDVPDIVDSRNHHHEPLKSHAVT